MAKAVLRIGRCIIAEKASGRRTDWKPSREMMRLREIEKIIRLRHGGMVPDPEDTDDRGTCLGYVMAAAFALSGQDMTSWCMRWAPWVRSDEIVGIEVQARKRRRMMTADGVAGLLGITWEQRIAFGLKTIGACDLPKEEREKLARLRKQERDRTQKAAARRASGKKNRNSYEAQSLSAQKPWEAEGMSRRTWYRRRGTGPSRVDIYLKGDTLVPTPKGDTLALTSPPISKPNADGVAGRRWGLGDHPPVELQEAEPHGSGDRISEEAA